MLGRKVLSIFIIAITGLCLLFVLLILAGPLIYEMELSGYRCLTTSRSKFITLDRDGPFGPDYSLTIYRDGNVLYKDWQRQHRYTISPEDEVAMSDTHSLPVVSEQQTQHASH